MEWYESYKAPGDDVAGANLIEIGYNETPEAHAVPKEEWCSRYLDNIRQYPRWELECTLSGVTIASAAFVGEESLHVGRCFTVLHQYVHPDYRNLGISRRIMRQAKTLAKAYGFSVLGWSHRPKPYEYVTLYKVLR